MKKIIKLAAGLALVAVIATGTVVLLSSLPVKAAPQGGQPCGGIAGLQCPNPNQVCVDDPRDNCDPKRGGTDCIGVCRGPGGSQ